MFAVCSWSLSQINICCPDFVRIVRHAFVPFHHCPILRPFHSGPACICRAQIASGASPLKDTNFACQTIPKNIEILADYCLSYVEPDPRRLPPLTDTAPNGTGKTVQYSPEGGDRGPHNTKASGSGHDGTRLGRKNNTIACLKEH